MFSFVRVGATTHGPLKRKPSIQLLLFKKLIIDDLLIELDQI